MNSMNELTPNTLRMTKQEELECVFERITTIIG